MPPKPSTSISTSLALPPDSLALLTQTNTTRTLLTRFLTALDSPTPPSTTQVDFSPLTLLAQSATLIRAHTTKVSLLLLNKPFTPSAIRKVLEQMTKEALPGMAAGVQLVQGMRANYGSVMIEEVGVRVRRVWRELLGLLEEIESMVQQEGAAEKGKGRNGSEAKEEGDTKNRDTLASTGVLWAACDAICELEKMGVPGLLVKKVALWRETLEDAIAELREWVEGGSDSDDDDEEANGDDEIVGSGDDDDEDDEDDMANFLNTTDSLPKNRKDLKQTADLALKRLKLTSTLYAAITKRRLKTLGMNEIPASTITKLDGLVDNLKRIPEETDELASAFYDLDDKEARRLLQGICGMGMHCVSTVEKSWKDEDDEFTIWAGKWREAIEKKVDA